MWVQVDISHTGTNNFACRQFLPHKAFRHQVSHGTVTLRVCYQNKVVTEDESMLSGCFSISATKTQF